MRDLLLIVFAFMLQPVAWLLPEDMTLPLILWLVLFIIALATFIWLLRQALRIGRGR